MKEKINKIKTSKLILALIIAVVITFTSLAFSTCLYIKDSKMLKNNSYYSISTQYAGDMHHFSGTIIVDKSVEYENIEVYLIVSEKETGETKEIGNTVYPADTYRDVNQKENVLPYSFEYQDEKEYELLSVMAKVDNVDEQKLYSLEENKELDIFSRYSLPLILLLITVVGFVFSLIILMILGGRKNLPSAEPEPDVNNIQIINIIENKPEEHYITCKYCGSRNREDASKCVNCGAGLK